MNPEHGADVLPEFKQYQLAFTRHIRNPQMHPGPPGVEPRRMAIYNRLLYNNVESFLLKCFPVCRKVLGEQQWNGLVRDFFANHRSAAPLFRQIPEEFVRFLESERADNAGDPPYLRHLAHYEWVDLALDIAAGNADLTAVDRDGDLLRAAPALNPVLWLLHYPYAVHRVGDQYRPSADQQHPTWILAFRNLDDNIRFILLNPVSARLISLLQERRQSGGVALDRIAAELRHPDPAIVRSGGLEILENLREQQAVLGTWK